MNKFGWFLVGAGAAAVGVFALGVAAVAKETRYIRYASDMSGDYELDMVIDPGRVRIGNRQVVTIRLTKGGKPLSDAQITLSVKRESGTATETFTTDNHGIAQGEFISFTPQVVNFTASYKTTLGTTVQAMASARWCTCGM